MTVPRPAARDAKPEPVEVRVVERAGQVHVAVRSSDPQLNRSLGENLDELVTQLETRGYSAETWRPLSSDSSRTSLTLAAGAATEQVHHGSPGRESFQEPGRGHHGGAGEDASHQQRRGRDEARPQWLEMLEGAVRERGTNPIRSTFA